MFFLLFISETSVPDPFNFGTDPDPALFVSDLQDANKNIFLLINF
jgi:hypothetical protein